MDALPTPFVEHLTALLGADELERIMAATTRPAVRVNTLKTSLREVERRFAALGIDAERVPFCDHALFIEDPQERGIGNLWEHQAGLLFSQDAASLLPVIALDPRPGERVLDLCAAPGGKAGHIAERMGDRGLVVANDPSPGRANNMASNLDRMGTLSTVITRADGVRRRWPMRFDRVLVDAPCSNLGHCHADKKVQFQFKPSKVDVSVGLQRGLLETAFHACEVGGTIVYSTCTLEVRENEAMVSAFADHFPVELERVEVGLKGREPPAPAVASLGEPLRDDVLDRTLRLHPGDADTDGFFVARLRKVDDLEVPDTFRNWNRKPHAVERSPEGTLDEVVEHYRLEGELLERASAVSTGTKVFLTTVDGLDDVLAMGPERTGTYLATPEPRGPRLSFEASTRIGGDAGRAVEVDADQARRWMAGQPSPAIGEDTWTVLLCEGEPIGCGRDFGDELQSYVPKNRRVPFEGEHVGFLALG